MKTVSSTEVNDFNRYSVNYIFKKIEFIKMVCKSLHLQKNLTIPVYTVGIEENHPPLQSRFVS